MATWNRSRPITYIRASRRATHLRVELSLRANIFDKYVFSGVNRVAHGGVGGFCVYRMKGIGWYAVSLVAAMGSILVGAFFVAESVITGDCL